VDSKADGKWDGGITHTVPLEDGYDLLEKYCGGALFVLWLEKEGNIDK
jgi:hypothetical protein